MSTILYPKKKQSRKKGKQPMVAGTPISARVATHIPKTTFAEDGTTTVKYVLESLMPRSITFNAEPNRPEIPPQDYEMNDIPPPSPPPPTTKTYKKQSDYLKEYVDRVDSLLEALLSREALEEGDKRCNHCERGVWAVWRCRDCFQGEPMCRGCMRETHIDNPFHRIERWTGSYFRSADLWEVGSYLLVRHHVGNHLCDNLLRHKQYYEAVEKGKDNTEQELLSGTEPAPAPVRLPTPGVEDQSTSGWGDIWASASDTDIDSAPAPEPAPGSPNLQSEEEFMRYLQRLHDGDGDDEDDSYEKEDDVEVEETDDPIVNRYLPNEYNPGADEPSGSDPSYSSGLPFIGTYIRVVHCNGIHNIAMVTCDCQGQNIVHEDLLAARLMPTSFQRIRTLFTVQLLDQFRLSNLELKASAYQFYQLLRRLTAPMDPAGVVDLYRELRRMSRLWRWMKRLKWAGRGSNDKPVNEVNAGELVIFCPACPQPGINIPDNWKDDPNRQVICRIFISSKINL
jgi:hypothetical protein